jgi:hypothetical protein
MAAGHFSASQPRISHRSKNWFTLREANRALPLVRRVVRDIVNTHQRATQLQARIEDAGPGEAAALHVQLEAALDSLQEYVDELTSIGVELKDYQTGLIDFPGRHQHRDVYLCWRLGEEEIGYWHELHTGFSGRQPISTLEEDET